MSAEQVEPTEAGESYTPSEIVLRKLGHVAGFVSEFTLHLDTLSSSERQNRNQTREEAISERWRIFRESIMARFVVAENVITEEWVAELHAFYAGLSGKPGQEQAQDHRDMQMAAHWLYLQGYPSSAINKAIPESIRSKQSSISGLRAQIIKHAPEYYPGAALQPTLQDDTLHLKPGENLKEVVDKWRKQNPLVQAKERHERQPEPKVTYEYLANQAARYIGEQPAGVYGEMFGLTPDMEVKPEMLREAREALFTTMVLNREIAELPSDMKLDRFEALRLRVLIGKKPIKMSDSTGYQYEQPLSMADFRQKAWNQARIILRQQAEAEPTKPKLSIKELDHQVHVIVQIIDQQLRSAVAKCVETAKFTKANPDH